MFSTGIQGSALSTYPSKFKGNPNAIITSIDTSAGILMSRTSGNFVPAKPSIGSFGSPACVQVSAINIVANGTITALSGNSISASGFLDLEFSWDFGDPTGTETIKNPVTGLLVNANTGQTGPQASYAYRAPAGGKTYTITLYARGRNASGKDVTAIATTTFTAVDQSQSAGYSELYVDSVNGNDSWSGTLPQPNAGLTDGPKATFVKTSGSLHGIAGVLVNNCCVYMACGSSWLDQGNISLPSTNAITTNGFLGFPDASIKFTSYVGKSGATAKPKLNTSSASSSPSISMGNGSNGFGQGAALTDVTISNLSCTTTSGTLAPCSILGSNSNDPSASMYDIYLDNCDFTQSSGMTSSGGFNIFGPWTRLAVPWSPDSQRISSWNCTYTSPSGGATIAASGNSYNSSTGVITLTTLTPIGFSIGQNCVLLSLTGTGSLANIESTSHPCSLLTVNGTIATFQGPTGQGAITITGGVVASNVGPQLSPGGGGWVSVGGGYCIGDGGDASRGHIVYSHVGDHLLYRWFSSKPPGVNKSYGVDYALNIESDPRPANLNSSRTLGLGASGVIGTGGTGNGAPVTLKLSTWKGPVPVAANMLVGFNTMSGIGQVTAPLLSTAISSFTYAAGVGTLNVPSHGVSANGGQLNITVTGADAGYNGNYIAKYKDANNLTVVMANPGSASATVPGSFTGKDFTITPQGNVTFGTYSGTLSMINLSSAFSGTLTASTNTVAVTAGSTLFGSGTSDIRVGDVVVFPGTIGSTPLLWAPITAVSGSPVSSFTITPHSGFNFANGSGTFYTLAPEGSGVTVINDTLVSGCELATTQGAHSGNSSTNDASYLKYTNFVCEDSSLHDLQLYGVGGGCLESYTFRNNYVWNNAQNPVLNVSLGGNTAPLAATVAWRFHGNKAYNNNVFLNLVNGSFPAADQPTSTLPIQFTDNEIWGSGSTQIGVGGYPNYLGNCIIDRNDYNFPANATFADNAGTGVAFGPKGTAGTWQALNPIAGVFNFDPNSSNINNATPASGVFSDWHTPIGAVSDFGSI